jgi:hypothetical protein
MIRSVLAFLLTACVVATGCGDDGGSSGGTDAADDGDGGVADDAGIVDAPGSNADATVPPGCVMGVDQPQCNNCLDDDNDGTIDGFDIECTGATDDDEGGFATGINGDNIDTVKQDCFFDGNSGSGDDGCEIHVCCLLGAPDQASCPFGPQMYDPAECDDPQSERCRMNCFDLTPPGCDCFGCCTLCDPVTDVCRDVITNPATAPNCDATTLNDPAACPSCTKVETCNNPCDTEGCILCPGQTPDDLPDTCNGQECPAGSAVCGGGTACPEGQFCIGGCCIAAIP